MMDYEKMDFVSGSSVEISEDVSRTNSNFYAAY